MKTNFEQIYSLEVHQNSIAFLVSAKLLRACGCGQIDLARVRPDLIEIFEVKSSPKISLVQKMRLKKAADFISSVTDLKTSLIYLVGR